MNNLKHWYEFIITKLFCRILNNHGGKIRWYNIILVRQSFDFYSWCYGEGYRLYKSKTNRK